MLWDDIFTGFDVDIKIIESVYTEECVILLIKIGRVLLIVSIL